MVLRRLLTVLLSVTLTMVACGDGGDGTTPTSRPGSPAVYQQIEVSTDCGELQNIFDVAAANHDTAKAGLTNAT